MGETIAQAFLQEEGYRIHQRNYRAGRGEIDLIAEKDQILVFVEVKTRRSTTFGMPEEAVGEAKQNTLLEAAEAYVQHIQWQGKQRFDIIAIALSPKATIYHITDAF